MKTFDYFSSVLRDPDLFINATFRCIKDLAVSMLWDPCVDRSRQKQGTSVPIFRQGWSPRLCNNNIYNCFIVI